MHDFVECLLQEIIHNPSFRNEQNTIAKSAGDVLTVACKSRDNEVAMVTKLCDNLHGKSCGKVKIYAKKIHGKKSMVTFYHGSKKPTKELADMAIISIATSGKTIVFEKIAFIQNKKEYSRDKKWKIDQEQLYLLHNFPTFDSVSGIFDRQQCVALPNTLGRLGNYGLFTADGDIIFVNARIINAVQDKKTVSFDRLRNETAKSMSNNVGHFIFDPRLMGELCCFCRHNHYWIPQFEGLPILGNCDIALNLYQFIRNWTQFNIGETVVCHGRVICEALARLTNFFISVLGIHNDIDYTRVESNDNNEGESESDGAVFVLHYKI